MLLASLALQTSLQNANSDGDESVHESVKNQKRLKLCKKMYLSNGF